MDKKINVLLNEFYKDIENSEKKEKDNLKSLSNIKNKIKEYSYLYLKTSNNSSKEKIKNTLTRYYNLLYYYQSKTNSPRKMYLLEKEIRKIPNIYIIDQKPELFDIDEKELNNIDIKKGLTQKQAIELLKWTVNNTRNNLNLNEESLNGTGDIYGNSSLNSYCGLSQFSSLYPLEKLGLKVTVNNTIEICTNRHAFGTVTIPIKDNDRIINKSFLIDCTYRQFFTLPNNTIGHFQNNSSPQQGFFISLDTNETTFAKQLLKNGFCEATPENLERYLKPFFATNIPINKLDKLDESFSKLDIKNIIENHQEYYDFDEKEFIDWGLNLDFPNPLKQKKH